MSSSSPSISRTLPPAPTTVVAKAISSGVRSQAVRWYFLLSFSPRRLSRGSAAGSRNTPVNSLTDISNVVTSSSSNAVCVVRNAAQPIWHGLPNRPRRRLVTDGSRMSAQSNTAHLGGCICDCWLSVRRTKSSRSKLLQHCVVGWWSRASSSESVSCFHEWPCTLSELHFGKWSRVPSVC